MENKVLSGFVLRCIKDCPYAKFGEIKKVDKKTEAFYSLLVCNQYFEIISEGEKETEKALKQAFAVGGDKMPDEFKNALIKGFH